MGCHLKGLFLTKELNIQLANVQDTVVGAESSQSNQKRKGLILFPLQMTPSLFFYPLLSFFSLNSRDMPSSLVRQPRVCAEKLCVLLLL